MLVSRIVLGTLVGVLGTLLVRRPALFFRYMMLGRRWTVRGDVSPSDRSILVGKLVGVALVVIALGVWVGLIPLSKTRS